MARTGRRWGGMACQKWSRKFSTWRWSWGLGMEIGDLGMEIGGLGMEIGRVGNGD